MEWRKTNTGFDLIFVKFTNAHRVLTEKSILGLKLTVLYRSTNFLPYSLLV